MAPLSDPASVFSPFDLAARPAILVAVSGGGDSLALLLLLREWARRRKDAPRIVAATVDHGLRPESAVEAAEMAQFSARLGIGHLSLRWEGPRPATGLMAAARTARYRLLAAAAGQVGTDLVLAGHTLDDQAETLWMRSRRGGDPAAPGLAGIAPATLHDGAVWFARPLLDVRREALRDWLRAAGVSWTDDPSNEAPRFERVRARQAVRAMDEAAFAALIEAGARARSARAALGREAALTMDAAATMPLPGLVRIGRDRLQRLDDDVRICLLRILLAVCGGCGHLPAAGDVASAWRSLPARRRVSLSRCLLDARRDAVFIHREGRGLPGPAELTHGDVWDGRYRLLAPDAQGAVRVEPAGDWSSPSDASTGVPPALARATMRRLPVAAERVIFEPVPGPWAKLLPSFDLAAAAATARLFGAKPPPAPPFAGHIGQTAFDACLTETQGHAWQG